jgi:2',3'-cyclic-nucleotide 2'-phosphodiesterase (5'-nucleotidase family)
MAENPYTLAVESGDLAYPDMGNGGKTTQLQIVAATLKAMGYAAVGVGPVDKQFGDNYYSTLQALGLPVVNLGVPEKSGAKPFIIKNFGKVKVGIFSFGMPTEGGPDDFATLKQRFQFYAEARQKCDVLVVLDQGNIVTDEWLERIAKRYGAPDIILTGTRNMSITDPRMVGETMILPTSVQVNWLSRVDVEINGGSKKKEYKKVQLDDTYKDDPKVLQMIRDYQAGKLVSPSPMKPDTASAPMIGTTPETTYYGYESCTSCHQAEYAQWKTTKHAKALKTLQVQNKTLAECLPCHSEMYKRVQRTAIRPDGLGGVECQSCHSNVVPHSGDYKAKHDTKAIHDACKTCHTTERSPSFNPAVYYPNVMHKKA